MNRSVIPSAAYLTVTKIDGYPNGHIILAFGKRQRTVLCRLHAYAQLKQLQESGQVDAVEAAFLRFQIGESSLLVNCPDEMETEIRELIEEGDKAAIFARDYFHPDVEKAIRAEVVPAALLAEHTTEKRIIQ